MDKEFVSEIPTDKWVALAPQLKLPQLDHLDREAVTIQCINSSDFVIGKQTNFNGPVTIISCSEVLKQGCHAQLKPNEETVTIEDKVLSRTAAKKVHEMATEEKPEFPDGQVKKGSQKNIKIYIAFLVVICCGLIAALTNLFTSGVNRTGQSDPHLNCSSLPRNACIVSNFPWGGRPIPEETKPLETPVPYVVISETHDEFCFDRDECLRLVKFFQLNMTKTNGCNFLLGGDGNVYEDLGWSWENSLEGPAAGKSLQICFMGDFFDIYPTYPQFVVAKNLINFAILNNYLLKDYFLVATNATSPNDSVGPFLYTVIKKWAHFVENPLSQ